MPENHTPITGANSLLLDALERTLCNPTAAHNWHRLLRISLAHPDPSAREHINQSLLREIKPAGIAGFFLYGFLAELTGDAHFVGRAAQLLQAIKPIDCDRLNAFAAYEWARILVTETNRSDFRRALQNACLPEIVRLQAGQVVSDFGPRLASRRVQEIRKVAVVTSGLSNLRHTPTLIVIQQVRTLQKLGFEVALFSSQELSFQDMGHQLANQGQVSIGSLELPDILAALPPGLDVFVADENYSIRSRLKQTLAEMQEFDPDLVYFVGLSSPLPGILLNHRPVLGLCIHSVPPIADVDVWLCADPVLANVESDDWFPAIRPAMGYYFPYRLMPRPVTKKLTRTQLALPAGALVVVSVGYRLTSEINGEWAAHMLDLVEQNHTLIWLLVGIKQLPPALQNNQTGRIKLLPDADNIAGVLSCCDIYVNPPRMGGGFSVIDAMAASLPVLTFDDTDGGAKLPEQAVQTQEDYFLKLQKLLNDRQMREQEGKVMRALFGANLDLSNTSDAPDALRAACEMSLRRYQQRMEKSLSSARNPLANLGKLVQGFSRKQLD